MSVLFYDYRKLPLLRLCNMIKIILFCLLIFPCRLLAQAGATDTILWSAKKLVWNNYKGNYDTAVYNRQYLAVTSWRVVYQYRPLLQQHKLEFIIYAWFDANKSWMQPKLENNRSLLLHEQGHFDLAEILTRQFRQRISEATFSRTNYADSIHQIFNKLLAAAYATQEKYDAETAHGTNSRRQAYWQTFIASELKKREAFTDKNVQSRLQ